MISNEDVKREVTLFMEKALDYAQVAVHKDNWPALRSKILRCGNDCLRNLLDLAGEE